MKAAATLRTFGYLSRATMVRRLPNSPTIMIRMATVAAKLRSGLENLGRAAASVIARALTR